MPEHCELDGAVSSQQQAPNISSNGRDEVVALFQHLSIELIACEARFGGGVGHCMGLVISGSGSDWLEAGALWFKDSDCVQSIRTGWPGSC